MGSKSRGAFFFEEQDVPALFDVIREGLPEFAGQLVEIRDDDEREFSEPRLVLGQVTHRREKSRKDCPMIQSG